MQIICSPNFKRLHGTRTKQPYATLVLSIVWGWRWQNLFYIEMTFPPNKKDLKVNWESLGGKEPCILRGIWGNIGKLTSPLYNVSLYSTLGNIIFISFFTGNFLSKTYPTVLRFSYSLYGELHVLSKNICQPTDWESEGPWYKSVFKLPEHWFRETEHRIL